MFVLLLINVDRKLHIFSKYFASVLSNELYSKLSMSKTAKTFSSLKTGTTISDFVPESQAICPSNFEISGTIIIFLSLAEFPQTPSPNAIFVHAILPWNGPK